MRQFEIATTIMLNLQDIARAIKDLINLKCGTHIDITYHSVTATYNTKVSDNYFVYALVEIQHNSKSFTISINLSSISAISDYCVKVANEFIDEVNKH